MQDKKVASFLVGLSISAIVLISFFAGGLADRIFVIKPLDYLLKRDKTASIQEKDGQKYVELPQIIKTDGDNVADISEAASNSVVTVSIKTKQLKFDPSDVFSYGFFGFNNRRGNNEEDYEEVQQDIGTGFVVDGNIVVTNKHVVDTVDGEYLVIDKNDKEYTVKKIYQDPDPNVDLALLQVEGLNLPALQLGDSDAIRVGESVIAIGTALGEFRHTVTTGVVSGLGRGITASTGISSAEELDGLIQTDAAVNPGNSGGPLIDNYGKVIGVNVAMANAENISFAIPINVVKDSLSNFNETGKFDRALLGVQYAVVDEETAIYNRLPQGAYIQTVVEGGTAADAGLKKGDIIIEFNGVDLKKETLAKLVGKTKVGDKVKIKYYRDSEEKEVTVTMKGGVE